MAGTTDTLAPITEIKPATAEPPRSAVRKWLTRGVPALIMVGLCVAAVYVLHKELSQHTYAELKAAVRSIPFSQLLLATLLTAASYAVLTGYDALALHTVGIPLPYRKTIIASFLGYVFSHNVGLSVLGGSAARFRMYSSSGLTAADVVKVFAFCALTFWLGLFALAGGVLIGSPELFAQRLSMPPLASRLLGGVLLGAAVAYVWLCWKRRTPLRIRTWIFPLPKPRLAIAQVMLSVVDWMVAGSVLYVLLPTSEITFFRFLGIFLASQLIAVTSHVPGGIGIFEGSVLLLIKDRVETAPVLGALLVYRAIYYLAPLAVGIVLLAAHEISRNAHHARRLANGLSVAFAEVSPRIVPRLLAFAAFWSGAVLLYSGATPPISERMNQVASLLPLALVEVAHFSGSAAGVVLLLVARGLYERLQVAWKMAVAMLVAGIVASLVKGLDWEEATLLALALAALLLCKEHFSRRASLLAGPLTWRWTAAITVILVLSATLATVSFRHVDVRKELVWTFAWDDLASRALRATIGAAAIAVAFGATRLVKRRQPEPAWPTLDELEQARRLARASDDPIANLALLGDKSLLWSTDGDGFLMFAVQGGSWIALGDPGGAVDEARQVVRRFHQTAQRHGGRTVFYEVLDERLPLYTEIGLSAVKLGEEARVEVASFTMEGRGSPDLRRACALLEQKGARFELVPPNGVAARLPELERVSAAWLARNGGREHGFSRVWFSRDYLVRFPLAVVSVDRRPIAFASVLVHEELPETDPAAATEPKPSREVLAYELLRHSTDAPEGTVDFLLMKLVDVARERGYRWLSLGMAPLPANEDPALVTLSQKLGGALFRHGDAGDDPQKVRGLKERFDPVWRPRFVVAPGGDALVPALKDVATLVQRGP